MPSPHRSGAQCPISWNCQLGEGRAAVHYLQHREPEPEPRFAGMELTRWSTELARGHQSSVWQVEAEESRIGDFLVCRECERSGQESEVEIIPVRKSAPPSPGPVPRAAHELRSRLTK